MRHARGFGLESGRFVYFKDEVGHEVAFTSIEEFKRYCPDVDIDLTGKYYMCYCPSIGMYEDVTRKPTDEDLSLKFEYLISHIDEISERKKDPLYNLPIDECKKIMINTVKRDAANVIIKKYPAWKQMNIINEGPQELRDQMTKDINSIRDASNKMEDEINSLKKLEKVKAYEIEFPEI